MKNYNKRKLYITRVKSKRSTGAHAGEAPFTNVMEICNDLSSKIKSSFIMTLFKQFADKNDVVIC